MQDSNSTNGIYAQRYDASGNKVGGEFRVNTDVTGGQDQASAHALADGGFIVTYTSDGRAGDDGNSASTPSASMPTALPMGRRSISTPILPAPRQTAPSAIFPVVVSSLPGLPLDQDGSGTGIYGQRFDAAGHAVGGEFQVNTTTDGNQVGSDVTTLSNGGFVVTWNGQGSDGTGIYMQRFDANGTPQGGETHVNAGGNATAASVTALAGGGFVVVWADSASNAVKAQIFDAAGGKVGGEAVVHSTVTGTQDAPSVTALADGTFVVTWNSSVNLNDHSVIGQRYAADGTPLGGHFTLTSSGSTHPDETGSPLVQLQDGSLVGVWQQQWRH